MYTKDKIQMLKMITSLWVFHLAHGRSPFTISLSQIKGWIMLNVRLQWRYDLKAHSILLSQCVSAITIAPNAD